jgi:hypothetical protein
MRIAAEHGTDRLVLLAADTKAEDPDLWRFVREASAHLGVIPVVVADGRTPGRSSPMSGSLFSRPPSCVGAVHQVHRRIVVVTGVAVPRAPGGRSNRSDERRTGQDTGRRPARDRPTGTRQGETPLVGRRRA